MFEAIQKKMKEGCWRFKAAWPELKEEWVDVWRRLVVLAIKIGRLSIKALCLSGKMIGVFFQNESVSNAEEKKEVAVMETMNNRPEINVRNSECEQEIKEQIKELLKAIREGCPEDFERIKKRVRKIVQDDLPPNQWPHDGVKRSSYDRDTQTIHLHPEVPAEHVQGVLAHWLGRSILHSRKGRIEKIFKDNKIGIIKPFSMEKEIKFHCKNVPDSDFHQLEIGDLVEYEIQEWDEVRAFGEGNRIEKKREYCSVDAIKVRVVSDCNIDEKRTAWPSLGQEYFFAPSHLENQILGDYYACSRWDRADFVQGARDKQFLEPSKQPRDRWKEPHWGWNIVLPEGKEGDKIFHRFDATFVRYLLTDEWQIVCQVDPESYSPSKFTHDAESIQRLKFRDDELLTVHLDKRISENDKDCLTDLCRDLPGYEELTEAEFEAAKKQLYIARAKRTIEQAKWTFISPIQKSWWDDWHNSRNEEKFKCAPRKRNYVDDRLTRCIIHSDCQHIATLHHLYAHDAGKHSQWQNNKGLFRFENGEWISNKDGLNIYRFLRKQFEREKISQLGKIENVQL